MIPVIVDGISKDKPIRLLFNNPQIFLLT